MDDKPNLRRVKHMLIPVAIDVCLYAVFLGTLVMSTFQTDVVCLHKLRMTWSLALLNVPETFGFLKNRVTPFFIATSDGEMLHAWHVLSSELYRKHE